MFQTLLNLRLLLVEAADALPDGEDVETALTWADLMEAEAAALIDGSAKWLPAVASIMDCSPGAIEVFERKARELGRADGRLSLILADQLTAALIRGHLQDGDHSRPRESVT